VAIAAALIDRNLPYFPIEISRMAASGPLALRTFRVGLSTPLAILIIMEHGMSNGPIWLGWLALQLIIWFDDINYWLGHMAGVTLLGMSTVWALYLEPSKWIFFTIAGLLWCLRLAFKAASVWLFELTPNEKDVFDTRLISRIFDRSLNIMYGIGHAPHPLTVASFQLAGGLQWGVFVLLAGII
jgi:hypothetical protein